MEKEDGGILKSALTPPFLKKRNDGNNEDSNDELLKKVRREGGVFSLSQGLEQLVDTLKKELARGGGVSKIHSEANVENLKFNAEKGTIRVCYGGNKELDCDGVLSTLPAFVLAEILRENEMKELRELSSVLFEIPYANIAVVNVVYKKNEGENRNDMDRIMEQYSGFGYLIPPIEKEKILGVTFDSTVFPEMVFFFF